MVTDIKLLILEKQDKAENFLSDGYTLINQDLNDNLLDNLQVYLTYKKEKKKDINDYITNIMLMSNKKTEIQAN